MRKLDELFTPSSSSAGLAAANGRGDQLYWRDHGRATGALMRHMAWQWGGDPELYYRVGCVHDLDYLRFPHDAPQAGSETECAHPVPLARAMRDMGVDPAVTLAVLEHAAYLGLYKKPSSRLSAALSAAEDLATIAALVPPFEDRAALSNDAQALLSKVRVRQKIRRTHRVRVEVDPARYVNRPLAHVVARGPFLFEV